MNAKDILLILLPVIVGVVSSYLTYFFTMRSNREQAILKFKEENIPIYYCYYRDSLVKPFLWKPNANFLRNNINHGSTLQME
jgi:hypothetical protein